MWDTVLVLPLWKTPRPGTVSEGSWEYEVRREQKGAVQKMQGMRHPSTPGYNRGVVKNRRGGTAAVAVRLLKERPRALYIELEGESRLAVDRRGYQNVADSVCESDSDRKTVIV